MAMKRNKSIKLARNEVALMRCLCYSKIRSAGVSSYEGQIAFRLIKKLEKLWDDELITGLGMPYNTEI